jgi:large subunit ribosomal protein L20
MTRVKGGIVTRRRHKKIINQTSGYRMSKHLLWRRANEARMKALWYAFRDRRQRRRQLRALWIVRINAAARMNGISYSRLIAGLKKANIELNRKMLAHLAVSDLNAFATIASLAKSA